MSETPDPSKIGLMVVTRRISGMPTPHVPSADTPCSRCGEPTWIDMRLTLKFKSTTSVCEECVTPEEVNMALNDTPKAAQFFSDDEVKNMPLVPGPKPDDTSPSDDTEDRDMDSKKGDWTWNLTTRAAHALAIALLFVTAAYGVTSGSTLEDLGETLTERDTFERNYGLHQLGSEWGGLMACNGGDCDDSRISKCTSNGHPATGESNDSNAVFNVDEGGSGNCLLTCDDGYMILVVEEGCVTGANSRTIYGISPPKTPVEFELVSRIIEMKTGITLDPDPIYNVIRDNAATQLELERAFGGDESFSVPLDAWRGPGYCARGYAPSRVGCLACLVAWLDDMQEWGDEMSRIDVIVMQQTYVACMEIPR